MIDAPVQPIPIGDRWQGSGASNLPPRQPRLMAREELVGARIESSAHSGAANVAYVQMQERTQ
jgi:hypothetical protein